ncbi:MAG TPA: purine nucleoside phosphorylase I, inosine and guanosine-specific [Candidatus Cryptobacteroides excrementigallinarum]|nr:purine nucleoside phosphorylase I, inosine and guanosine-specific [Candidatus Cryptobacteroides excrementigallinarum]
MDQRLKTINQCADFIRSKADGRAPLAGIILGSGLGKLAEKIEDATVISYGEIPGFPVSTAIGHKGNFIIGTLGGKTVIAMQGRFHYYEGYSMDMVTMGVRVMKCLGIEYLFVSNAAGACNQDYKVGDLIIIRDHINMMPNPLIGPNIEEFGPRFPDMTCAYDLKLQALAESLCEELGIPAKKGVYFGSTGPSYETPAEVRFFHTVGADLVGMSTIPEVIVARHCGIKVFGMSVVTNISNFLNLEKNYNDGEDVVMQADMAADRMTALFTKMIEAL